MWRIDFITRVLYGMACAMTLTVDDDKDEIEKARRGSAQRRTRSFREQDQLRRARPSPMRHAVSCLIAPRSGPSGALLRRTREFRSCRAGAAAEGDIRPARDPPEG